MPVMIGVGASALAGTGRPAEMMQASPEALTREDCRTHRLVTPIELYPLFGKRDARALGADSCAVAARECAAVGGVLARCRRQ